MGRPSVYTQEIADEICAQLAEGKSLRSICEADRFPTETAVRKWALEDRQGFSSQYARARQIQYERMADEVVDIADSATPEDYNPARLRVDARKWILSKVLPKVYGEATLLKHADPDGNALTVTVTRIEPKK